MTVRCWRQPTDSTNSDLHRRLRLPAAAPYITSRAATRAPAWRRLRASHRRRQPPTRRKRRERRSPGVRSSSWKNSSNRRNICRWVNERVWRHCSASPRRRWATWAAGVIIQLAGVTLRCCKYVSECKLAIYRAHCRIAPLMHCTSIFRTKMFQNSVWSCTSQCPGPTHRLRIDPPPGGGCLRRIWMRQQNQRYLCNFSITTMGLSCLVLEIWPRTGQRTNRQRQAS